MRIISHFTKDISKVVDGLLARLEGLDIKDTKTATELEGQVESLIEGWNRKVRKLGGEPKGIWMADFDSGDGYYCWKFPESDIQHWHDRNSGFASRITLHEREKRLIHRLQAQD